MRVLPNTCTRCEIRMLPTAAVVAVRHVHALSMPLLATTFSLPSITAWHPGCNHSRTATAPLAGSPIHHSPSPAPLPPSLPAHTPYTSRLAWTNPAMCSVPRPLPRCTQTALPCPQASSIGDQWSPPSCPTQVSVHFHQVTTPCDPSTTATN